MNTSFDNPARVGALDAVTIIPAGAGERLSVIGHDLQFKLTSAETGGALSLWLENVPPGGGPPPHIHHSEDEIFLVLEGEITFWSETGTTRAGPGTVVFGPRRVPHTFRNTGDRTAHMAVIVTPGGFEDFFRASARPAGDTSPAFPPSPDAIARAIAAAPRAGLEFLHPAA